MYTSNATTNSQHTGRAIAQGSIRLTVEMNDSVEHVLAKRNQLANLLAQPSAQSDLLNLDFSMFLLTSSI